MKPAKYLAAAERWRTYIERRWPTWRSAIEKIFPSEWMDPATTPSAGMCDLTTVWLQSIIGGELKGGFIHPTTTPHAWLEHSGLIIDLTADQFGFDPVIVTPRFEGFGDKYIEMPGDPALDACISFNREFLRLMESE